MKEKISIDWSYEDVLHRDENLLKYEACEILEMLEIEYDKFTGINYLQIDAVIEIYKFRKVFERK